MTPQFTIEAAAIADIAPQLNSPETVPTARNHEVTSSGMLFIYEGIPNASFMKVTSASLCINGVCHFCLTVTF